MIINKISVLCTITFLQTHMFKPLMEESPFSVKVSLNEFQDLIDRACVYNTISDETNVIFISNLEDITMSPYAEQPRSMLCGKLEKLFIEQDDPPPPDREEFDHTFLPNCFRHLRQ